MLNRFYKLVLLGGSFLISSCGPGLCVTGACLPPIFSQFDLVLGQANMAERWRDKHAINYGNTAFGSGGGKYFRADNRSRVFIFNSFPTTTSTPDVVLGVPNRNGYSGAMLSDDQILASTGAFISPRRIGGSPACVAVSPLGRLYICDPTNNRVLVWNSIPTEDFAPADLVLGQPDFYSDDANNGGIGPATLSNPVDVTFDGVRVLISDRGNQRILVWNNPPSSNFEPANVVVGQADFVSTVTTILNAPGQMAMVGAQLWLANTTKNRVNVWNTVPVANNVAPDQSFVVTNPTGIASDGTHLVVTLGSSKRALVFDTIPANLTTPDRVLGQPDAVTTTDRGESATDFRPGRALIDGSRIIICNRDGYRVLIWNSLTPATFAPVDAVLGSESLTPGDPFLGPKYFVALDIAIDSTRMAVADYNDAYRIMVWNSLPTATLQAADIAVGRPDLNPRPACTYQSTSCATPSSSLIHRSEGVGLFNNGLVVSDTTNHRALIWNQVPTVNSAAADVVLGQPNDTTVAVNNGSRSAQTLDDPVGILYAQQKLFIADRSSHRVLVWDSWPTALRQAADWVIGQAAFADGTANSGGSVSATSLNTPTYLASDGTRFAIADTGNNRVLIWNTFPTTWRDADIVLGQADFTGSSANRGGSPDASTLSTPYNIVFSGSVLSIVDSGNNRILIWKTLPTENGKAADAVIGQPDFTSYRCQTMSNTSLCGPRGLARDGAGNYWAIDAKERILRYTLDFRAALFE